MPESNNDQNQKDSVKDFLSGMLITPNHRPPEIPLTELLPTIIMLRIMRRSSESSEDYLAKAEIDKELTRLEEILERRLNNSIG